MTGKCPPRVIRTLEEWDENQLILGADIRDCAGCNQPTFWRTARQPKRGRCQDCQPWTPVTEDVLEAVAARAVDLLLDAFPESDVNIPVPPDDEATPHLFRQFWLIARRWEQHWVWVTPRDARCFNQLNRKDLWT